jgi:hypothetical protein
MKKLLSVQNAKNFKSALFILTFSFVHRSPSTKAAGSQADPGPGFCANPANRLYYQQSQTTKVNEEGRND